VVYDKYYSFNCIQQLHHNLCQRKMTMKVLPFSFITALCSPGACCPNAAAAPKRVVLGNLEQQRTWSNESKCAPVLAQIGARWMASEAAASCGRRLKPADCKNVFCQPYRHPKTRSSQPCPRRVVPFSKPGTCWKRIKTCLHGWTRSPRHGCDKTSGVLTH